MDKNLFYIIFRSHKIFSFNFFFTDHLNMEKQCLALEPAIDKWALQLACQPLLSPQLFPRLPKPTFVLDLAAAVNVLSHGKQGDASPSALISQPLWRIHGDMEYGKWMEKGPTEEWRKGDKGRMKEIEGGRSNKLLLQKLD